MPSVHANTHDNVAHAKAYMPTCKHSACINLLMSDIVATLFCYWETDKPGGVATVHHSVNEYFEVNSDIGWLTD